MSPRGRLDAAAVGQRQERVERRSMFAGSEGRVEGAPHAPERGRVAARARGWPRLGRGAGHC